MAGVVQKVRKWYLAEIRCMKCCQPVLLLLLRLYFGWAFFKAGMGKLQNIDTTASYLADLGIPMPTLNACLSGATECIGGLLLLLGAASRVITIPLIFTMLVAYFTAHKEELRSLWTLNEEGKYDPTTFIKAPPFAYLLTAFIVLFFGPGAFSVDGVLKWYFDKKEKAAEAGGKT